MTRILVTGGRDYRNRERLYAVLDRVRATHHPMLLVHGEARGADQLAHEWAVSRGVEIERHPADWTRHGRAAGPIRNAEMVLLGAALCVAFPGGTGTKNCVTLCMNAGIPVLHEEVAP